MPNSITGEGVAPHAGTRGDGSVRLSIGTLMLALGDSIAAGIGASHASQGCMALMAARLAAGVPSLRFRNLAVPGETSHSMLAPDGQLAHAEQVLAEVISRGDRPGPLLLSIGGNDAMEAALLGDGVARKQLRANLETVVSRLAAALAPAGVSLGGVACIQTIYNPFEEPDGNGVHNPDALAPRRAREGGFNRVIREVAATAGMRVAEVSRAFRGRATELTWVRSGDIHPSDDGHRVIAQAYESACGWANGLSAA